MNQILPEDFDNAVKQKWNADTCIIAQQNLRVWEFTDMKLRWSICDDYPRAEKAMQKFDRHFREPGDENKPELQALRASLPIDL